MRNSIVRHWTWQKTLHRQRCTTDIGHFLSSFIRTSRRRSIWRPLPLKNSLRFRRHTKVNWIWIVLVECCSYSRWISPLRPLFTVWSPSIQAPSIYLISVFKSDIWHFRWALLTKRLGIHSLLFATRLWRTKNTMATKRKVEKQGRSMTFVFARSSDLRDFFSDPGNFESNGHKPPGTQNSWFNFFKRKNGLFSRCITCRRPVRRYSIFLWLPQRNWQNSCRYQELGTFCRGNTFFCTLGRFGSLTSLNFVNINS